MIADSSEIRFECAQCGQSIAVDISGAGVSTNCPTCDHPLVVPSPGSLHDREYGEGASLPPGRTAFADEDTGISASEAEELREELAEALRRAEESGQSLSAARNETARVEQRAATAEAQLADARTMIADLGARLAAAEENRAQWEQACAQNAEQANASETQFAARETELRAALAEARGGTEVLAAERTALRGHLESAEAEARTAAAAVAEKLAAAQAAFEDAEAGRQGLAERCQALRKESETLRRDLSEIHTGRELLALRDTFQTLETEHQRATAALARSTTEVQSLTASGDTLRADITEARARAADAEHRAEAASGSALKKDNEVLRGIIERQNSVGEARYVELRKLRRARLMLRILYALGFLAVIGLAALAIDYLPAAAKHFLHEWFGLQ